MKRSLFVLCFLALAASASAQSLTFRAGTQVKEALRAIAACADLQPPIYDPQVTLDAQRLLVDGKIDDCHQTGKLLSAIQSAILPGLYVAGIDPTGALHIGLANAEHATNPSITEDQMVGTPKPSESRRAIVDRIVSRYPQAYGADGAIGSYNQLAAMNREIYPQIAAMQFESPAYGSAYSGSVNYGGFFANAYEYSYPAMLRDFANQEKYGLLKIDGPDRFLRTVRVLIDGADVAAASKANNSWNSPIWVTAGNHVIEFVLESKDGIFAFRRTAIIQPIAVTGNNPTRLRVSGNEFANGQEVYTYRQHRFVETTDGRFEPKPKQ